MTILKKSLFSFIVLFGILLVINNGLLFINPHSKQISSSSTTYPIIRITGNSELDTFPNKTGGGTLLDPYIIEDLFIDVAGELISAIKITETDRYLILQNLTISGSMGYWSDQDAGIGLFNCENINITQCLFTNNRFSTRISHGKNCYVYNNTSHDNYSGLYTTDTSEGLEFFNNTCYNNYEGIHSDGGQGVKIYNNVLFQNDLGVYILYGEYFDVVNNDIKDCVSGIYLRENGRSHVFNNIVRNCTNGINLYQSFINILKNNSLIQNSVGIRFNTSSYNANLDTINSGNTIDVEELNSDQNDFSGEFQPKISLHGNSQLALFPNKTGSGTQMDPYVINDLVIDAERVGSPVEIHHTTSYLVIQNLLVTGAHNDYEQNDGGIELYQCKNVNITKCYFVRNEFGVHLNNNSNCNIYNNTAAYNWQHGIYTRGGYNLHVFNNSIHHGYSGIHTDGDYNHVMNDNQIHHECFGIKLNWAINCTVSHNSFSNIYEHGVQLYYGRSNKILYNNFTECSQTSMNLIFSGLNVIVSNRFQNSYRGIVFNGSSYNNLDNNEFINITSTEILEIDSTNMRITQTPHPKININGNDNLIAFPNKTGLGTYDNPYVIKNLYINGMGISSAILIQCISNQYLILENLLVLNAGEPDEERMAAIQIVDCNNIIIRNCTAVYCYRGFSIVDSSVCEIYNSTLNGNQFVGIFLNRNSQSLTDIRIHDNIIKNNGYGIDFDGGYDCIVSKNIFENNNYVGIELSGTSNLFVHDNLFITNGEDKICIQIIDAITSSIENNVINFERLPCGIGIDHQSSDDSYITNNAIYHCKSGIEMYRSDSNTIAKNRIIECDCGIRLKVSDYNTIDRNVFQNNLVDYVEQNSIGNKFIELKDWKNIGFWASIGVFGFCIILFASIFIPIRRRNAPKRNLTKAMNLMKKENFSKALTYLDRTLLKEQTNTDAWNLKLSALYSLNRYKEVLLNLNQALKTNLNFPLMPSMKDKIDQIEIRDYIDKAMKEMDG